MSLNQAAVSDAISYFERWAQYRFARETVPGAQVAIAHNGKTVFSRAFGVADLTNNTPLTTTQRFRIASHSKMFATVSVLLLAERGQLQLDDPLAKYLRWMETSGNPELGAVTLRQVLTHTSGIIRDGEDCDYWSLDFPFPDEDQLKAMFNGSAKVLEPLQTMKYSNIAYSLIGMVVETVSGTPFRDFVQTNIFDVLGMNSSGADFSGADVTTFATPHSANRDGFTRYPLEHVDTGAMTAATGLFSTAEDLCRFGTALVDGNDVLLTQTSKLAMRMNSNEVPLDDERYGLGVEIVTMSGYEVVGHGGGFPGFITKTMVDPKNNIVISVLTNAIDGEPLGYVNGFFDILKLAESLHSDNKPKADLEKFCGRFYSVWDVIDIAAIGNQLLEFGPGNALPAKFPSRLSVVNDTTLRIDKANGFESEGELIIYNFGADGTIESIRNKGATFLPRDAYVKKYPQAVS